MHASGLDSVPTVPQPGLTIRTVRWPFLVAPVKRLTVLAISIVAVFTTARLVFSRLVGFGVDEFYILSISHDLQLSYLDHPPLHIWLAHFGQMVLGQGHAVRLPFVLLSAISSWLMYAREFRVMQLSIEAFKTSIDLLRRTGDAEAAIVAQLALDVAMTESNGVSVTSDNVRTLLRARIVRHRAQSVRWNGTVH